jgi:hypothetical protein
MGPSPPANTQENGTRTRITQRKGWSESIGGVIYSKAKRMLENE